MSGERSDQPEQEISIKYREQELFVDDPLGSTGPVKPFADYLRETPPTPLSGGVKAALWAVSLIAAVLFAAALWKLINQPTQPIGQRPRAKSSSRASARKVPSSPLATTAVAVHLSIPSIQEFRR